MVRGRKGSAADIERDRDIGRTCAARDRPFDELAGEDREGAGRRPGGRIDADLIGPDRQGEDRRARDRERDGHVGGAGRLLAVDVAIDLAGATAGDRAHISVIRDRTDRVKPERLEGILDLLGCGLRFLIIVIKITMISPNLFVCGSLTGTMYAYSKLVKSSCQR